MNLVRLFQKIEISETKDVFNALPIGNNVKHRLAKTYEGYPVLMICTKKSFENRQKFSLQNLKIQQNIECNIKDKGTTIIDYFTLITFTNTSTDLQLYFLRIAEPLINLLTPQPTEKEVTNVIFKFLEVFKALSEPAHKSVLGLWGELLVIAESVDADLLINAWHNNPFEKYDFGLDNWRIEVKTSTKNERIHSFSLEQLNPPYGIDVNVASILTKQTVSGKSFQDLSDIIRAKVNDLNLISKLDLVVAQTLGDSMREAQNLKFDLALARQTLRFYSSENIPKIKPEQVTSMVFDVKFSVLLL